MKKSVKIWLMAAVSLIVLGGMIFTITLAVNNWDITKLSNVKFVDSEYDFEEAFQNINIDSFTTDITFAPSADGKCRAVLHERTTEKHTALVENGTLSIKAQDSRKWYEYISLFFFESPRLTLYIPEKNYKSITVNCATGNISAEQLTADTLKLTVATGAVKLDNVAVSDDIYIETGTGKIESDVCASKELFVKTGTGEVTLKDTVTTEKLSVETGTGSVRLDACDSKDINVETGTGSISGTLLSDKVFITETGVGSVSVPQTTSGGKCELTTGTGSIDIKIAN